LLKIKP